MREKNALGVAVFLLAAFAGYMVFSQIPKYRALRSLTIDAIAECKENLTFLHNCESFMRDSVSETDAMTQAQGEIKMQLKSRAINGLIKAGISGRKKEAVIRLSDEIDGYNGALAYAFYASTGASVSYPESAATMAGMIKEFLEFVKMMEK